jgi:hypothetical protein
VAPRGKSPLASGHLLARIQGRAPAHVPISRLLKPLRAGGGRKQGSPFCPGETVRAGSVVRRVRKLQKKTGRTPNLRFTALGPWIILRPASIWPRGSTVDRIPKSPGIESVFRPSCRADHLSNVPGWLGSIAWFYPFPVELDPADPQERGRCLRKVDAEGLLREFEGRESLRRDRWPPSFPLP